MTGPRDLVIDASVALAAALLEPLHEQALAVLEHPADRGSGCLCPDVFDAECAAGIVKAVRQGRLREDRIERTWTQLADLPLERRSSRLIGAEALSIALAHGISAFDAAYVALSRSAGLPLVTADERLVRMLVGSGYDLISLETIATT